MCWHWAGLVNERIEELDPAQIVRNIQHYHLTHRRIDYSDIAYSYLIGWDARVYECRGLGHRSGAEGPLVPGLRGRRYVSVCFVTGYRAGVSPREEVRPSEEMLAAGVALARWLRAEVSPDLTMRGHGEIRRGGKDCPGPTLTRWVHNTLPEALAAPTDGPWWASELAEAVDAGITDGSRPTESATRAEAAVMALRASRQ